MDVMRLVPRVGYGANRNGRWEFCGFFATRRAIFIRRFGGGEPMTINATALTGSVIPVADDHMRQPLPLVHVEEPVTITIFGASGDLTLRKLMPALYALYARGLFRERFTIVGFARKSLDDASFRQHMREAVKTFSRLPADEVKLREFADRLYYHQGDLDDPEAFRALRDRFRDEGKYPTNRVHYLAVTP